MTGVAKGTVTRLLECVGKSCGEYQDVILRNLSCKTIQCDEVWFYCYAKCKNVPEQNNTKIAVFWELYEQGLLKSHISKQLMVTRETVHIWIEGIASHPDGLLGFLE